MKVECILCCRLYWGQCLEYADLDYSFHCNPGNTYQPNRNIFFISPQLGLPLLISVAMPLMWHTISPGSFSNGWMGTTSTFTCKIFWIFKLCQISNLFEQNGKYPTHLIPRIIYLGHILVHWWHHHQPSKLCPGQTMPQFKSYFLCGTDKLSKRQYDDVLMQIFLHQLYLPGHLGFGGG